MGAVWMRARAELRARWRALLGLCLLVGLSGGTVLGAAMGARRTQTAYPRLLEASNASDVLVSAGGRVGIKSGFYEAVAAIPEVDASGLGIGIGLTYPGRNFSEVEDGLAIAALDDGFATAVDRPNVLDGRLPDPRAADEVFINKAFADVTGVRAGERLEVRQLSERGPAGRRFTVEVVGIGVTATEVIPIANLDGGPAIILPRGVLLAHIDVAQRGFEALAVALRPGTDVGRFERSVRAMADDYSGVGDLFFASAEGRPAVVQRALRPQVVALGAFAALTGITMLLVIGQALARQVRLDADDNRTLGALGMSRAQLFVMGLARVGAVTVAGALFGVASAVATSPLTPIGPARLAETSPGVHANAALLAGGALVLVLALVGATVFPAWRAARTRASAGESARPSALAALFARAGRRASAAVGVRMALEPGRGRTAVPVRSTLVGTMIALAAVVAAFTFGASLDRLVSTPRLYGQDWDVFSDTQFDAVFPSFVELVKTDPSVESAAGGTYGLLNVGGEVVPAVGLDPLRGTAFPTLLEGRPPSEAGEIVLGTTTLRRLRARVGDRVEVAVGSDARPMLVVGRAVFPKLGQGSFTPTALGEGAAVSADALESPGTRPGRYTFLLIRTKGTRSEALSGEITRLCEATGEQGNLYSGCTPPQRPTELDNFAQMRGTPYVLTGILAALALATLAHALITSVSRRRRDLAVLKTIGFVRGQISGAVAWQATTLTALALLVGLPVGFAAGRWGWTTFAGQLGVLPEASTPVASIAIAAAVAVAAANLTGAVPARAAARTRPAEILRSE